MPKLYSGDIKLSFSQSIAYYMNALSESFRGALDGTPSKKSGTNPSSSISLDTSEGAISPMRFWTEWALKKEITSKLPGQAFRVLDVGCGSGRYHIYFKGTNVPCEYVGFDIKPNEKWNALSKENGPLSIKFYQDNVEQLSNLNGKFDLWISSTALEHFENEPKALDAISRHLKAGAVGVHVIPSHHSWMIYFKHGYRRYWPARLKALFESAGHEVLSIEGLGGPFSFATHFVFVTVPERVLRIGAIRNPWLLKLYEKFLRMSVALDWNMPPMLCLGYSVVARYSGSKH